MVNFPNVTLHCKHLIINCISGSTAKETLRMTNNGPLPVIYKFLWAGESIEIQREAHDVGVELHRNTKNSKYFNTHHKLFPIIFNNPE